MGTKSNPGAFNCHAAALPDETIFTLLARDPAFPAAVRAWIDARERLGKNVEEDDIDKLDEADGAIGDAVRWRKMNLDPVGDGTPSWKLPRPTPEPGEDRPVRFDPTAAPPTDPRPDLIRKIVMGLRQLADESVAIDAGTHSDRINGFAAELEAGAPPMEFSGYLEEVDPRRMTQVERFQAGIALSGDTAEGLFDQTGGAMTDIDMGPAKSLSGDKAESDMVDLAAAPVAVPPHRFSYFFKGEHYAYARGLEINPSHLPLALDAMRKDGYRLVSLFGQTDSASVGFIFERDAEVVVKTTVNHDLGRGLEP